MNDVELITWLAAMLLAVASGLVGYLVAKCQSVPVPTEPDQWEDEPCDFDMTWIDEGVMIEWTVGDQYFNIKLDEDEVDEFIETVMPPDIEFQSDLDITRAEEGIQIEWQEPSGKYRVMTLDEDEVRELIDVWYNGEDDK